MVQNNEDAWTRRKYLRSDTSDEEDLEDTTYCTVCGSESCRRKPDVCKDQGRLEIVCYLALGLEQYGKDKRWEDWQKIAAIIVEEKNLREKRVRKRIDQKQKAYMRRLWCVQPEDRSKSLLGGHTSCGWES